MSRSIYFFATKGDIESLLAAVESKSSLKYIRADTSDSPDLVTVLSGIELPQLGYAPSGDWNQEPWWLVMKPSTSIEARPIALRRGGTRYAIDQELNPESVAFKAGGLYADRTLIAGQVGTSADDSVSKDLLNLFVREIRRHFRRVKSFFVGPEAEELLDSGYRLTTSVKSPTEYDLSRA